MQGDGSQKVAVKECIFAYALHLLWDVNGLQFVCIIERLFSNIGDGCGQRDASHVTLAIERPITNTYHIVRSSLDSNSRRNIHITLIGNVTIRHLHLVSQ